MWRKRATPAPAFRVPAPYNPITGEYAPIGVPRYPWRVALLQVSEADTRDNYVVCRGFDPEDERFYNSLAVAKPYGARGSFDYVVGQVLCCGRSLSKLGTNPGKAETTVGHPADLTEEIVLLYDDDGNPLEWMEISAGPPSVQVVTVAKDGGSAGAPDPGGSNCSFTYTLTSMGGTELATGVTPEQARYPLAIYLEAGAGGRSDLGLAYNILGVWFLIWLPGEIADATVC